MNMNRSNQHEAPCRVCGEMVEVGKGRLFLDKTKDKPQWYVKHHRRCMNNQK